MRRRAFLSALGTGVGAITLRNMRKTRAAEIPGVTATEIRIGNTMPYSGIGSDFGVIGRGDAAYFRMINDQGGINGRMIHFISLDDSYTPPKTVEQTRRLVEQDQVAFIFNGLGTAPGSAVRPYLNHEHVPQLFLMTGADKWGNFQQFPWTLGWQPSYRTEAQIYAKYILANRPDAKIALFWQNDDWGKDFVTGVKDVLSERFDRMVVRSVSYEATDPTVDSQVVAMQSSGADTVVSATASVKFAQAVRKMHGLGWKPLHLVSNNAASIGGVLRPAGIENVIGIITAGYLKDPNSPEWADDPGMNAWRAFMSKYLPDADTTNSLYVYAYGVSMTLVQVLRQCGDDLTRANIMRQAANLHDLEIPVLLPGIRVNTNPTNYHPIRQMQLQRFDGERWQRFGELIEGSEA